MSLHPFSITVFAIALGAPLGLGAQLAAEFELFIPDAVLVDSAPGDARVRLDNELPTFGWSYGVCHDSSQLELIDVQMGSTTAMSSPQGGVPAFYSVQLFADGFAVGVVVDFDHPLSPGLDRELDVATYQSLVPPPATIPLMFCDTLGSPPVALDVVDSTGANFVPGTTDGTVFVRTRSFVRSDCNSDGAVDVADVVFLGGHLFGLGLTPDCAVACDANSDLGLDVADMVYAIDYLFAGGPLPATPFPLCGVEPTPSLACEAPPPCP